MAPEFRSYRVEAIVLRHTDWGEADRILKIFTRQQGKLRVVIKGVRKIRSRKAGHVEPFTHVALQLAKSRDLPIVSQAEMITNFQPLREDLELIGYASYVVELLDQFTYEEGENQPIYNLLLKTLSRLSQPEEFPDIQLVVRYYEMRLLDYVGFRPDLFQCVVSGEVIQPEAQFFSAEHGGVVCPACASGIPGLRPVSMEALRFLRHLQRSNFVEANRARPQPAIHREMEILMQHYLTYLLERRLNSPRFIREVRNGGGWFSTPKNEVED